jgi:hypothetical protein
MPLETVAGIAGIVAALVGAVPTNSPQVVDGPHIVVDVVNEAGAPPEVVQTARSRVTGIYKPIGVGLVWIDTGAIGPEVVILKIVRDGKAERLKAAPDSLGVALTGGRGRGRFAYVFYDRIEIVSRRNRLDPGTVLGTAIAHELAHLLLPHGSHSARGLMSADWSRADLLTADRLGLSFTAEQGMLIRADLESRARASFVQAPMK